MCEVFDCNADWYEILSTKQFYNTQQVKCAKDYVQFNFMNVIEDNYIFELDVDTFVEIINSDNLNVHNEEFVFNAANKWIKKRDSNSAFKRVFEAVRMPLLSPKCLLDEVYPLTLTTLISSKQFIDAIKYHIMPNERGNIPEQQIKPRKIIRKLLAVGSLDFNTSSIIEMYDSVNNSWTLLKNFDLKKRNYTAGIIDNCLMIIGGYNKNSLNSVEMIDLMTGQLSTAASLKVARHNSGVAVLGTGNSEVIYTIGGAGLADALNSVEKWNPVTRDWSFTKPMHFKRNYPGVAVLDNKIYVLGGKYLNNANISMEMYDPTLDKWEMKASINHIRYFCVMTTVGNYIYAAGGYVKEYGGAGSNVVEKYDPVKNSWITIASISANGIVGLGALGNKMIRAGGTGSNNSVEEYDPDTNQWKFLARLNRGREVSSIVEMPWSFYKCKFNW